MAVYTVVPDAFPYYWESCFFCFFPGSGLGVSLFGYVSAMLNRPWKGLLKLDRGKYAATYRKINLISKKEHGSEIHTICISSDFNASVAFAFSFCLFETECADTRLSSAYLHEPESRCRTACARDRTSRPLVFLIFFYFIS